MFRYRVETQTTTSLRWWAVGLYERIDNAVRFMNTYDADGTARMRIWDIEEDEAVSIELLFRIKQRYPKPQVNWINDGF